MAENCCQCAVNAGPDSRIVIVLLADVLFESMQVPSYAIDVEIFHFAAAIAALIAAKPGFALVANFSKTVLPIGNTITGEAMCVLEVFTAMVLEQTIFKVVSNRINVCSVTVWIVSNGSGRTRRADGMGTCHPECSVNGVNAGIYEESAAQLNIIDPYQMPEPAFDSFGFGRVGKCFVCVEGAEHPYLAYETVMTALYGLDIKRFRGDRKSVV